MKYKIKIVIETEDFEHEIFTFEDEGDVKVTCDKPLSIGEEGMVKLGSCCIVEADHLKILASSWRNHE